MREKKPPKNTESVEFRRWMAHKIDGKPVRYVLERSEDGVETIIGRSGFLHINGGDFSVICGEKTLFMCKVDDLKAWEFLSLEGVVLTCYDMINGKERTILAYYKYYRD